jgi:hypothetical protein
MMDDNNLAYEAALARLRGLLASLEWAGDSVGNRCPSCGGWKKYGHAVTCRLVAELRDR